MYKLSYFHVAYLRQHMKQHGILAHIPIICRQHVLGALIQDPVQRQPVTVFFFCHIKCHTVSARIQVHLMQILMYIEVCHNTAAIWIIL